MQHTVTCNSSVEYLLSKELRTLVARFFAEHPLFMLQLEIVIARGSSLLEDGRWPSTRRKGRQWGGAEGSPCSETGPTSIQLCCNTSPSCPELSIRLTNFDMIRLPGAEESKKSWAGMWTKCQHRILSLNEPGLHQKNYPCPPCQAQHLQLSPPLQVQQCQQDAPP